MTAGLGYSPEKLYELLLDASAGLLINWVVSRIDAFLFYHKYKLISCCLLAWAGKASVISLNGLFARPKTEGP